MWLTAVAAVTAIAAVRSIWRSAEKKELPGMERFTSVPVKEFPSDLNDLKYDPRIEYAMIGSKVTVRGFRSIAADKTSAEISGKAQVIADQAFMNCTELKSIYVPDSVTYIGSSAFYGCTALHDVRLPRGLKTIHFWCFRDCKALDRIEIPDTVTEIELCSFWRSGLKTLELPDSVQKISQSAFSICKSLTDVKLSKNLKKMETSAFECTDSLGFVELPESLEEMDDRVFRASGIMGINIPPKLTAIKTWTFRDCKRLKEIYIPDNITEIGEGAFMGCDLLESVRLPRGMEIDNTVFDNCYSLCRVTAGRFKVIMPAMLGAGLVGSFMSVLVRRLNSGIWGKDNSFEENTYGRDAMYSVAFQLWEYGFAGIEEYLTADMAFSIDRAVKLDHPAAFDRLVDLGARLTAEQTDEYIDRAADRLETEMYLSLIRYKRDILGYDTDNGITERFEL